MFTFDHDGKKYKVYFKHYHHTGNLPAILGTRFNTDCAIVTDDKTVEIHGSSMCSLKDNPCKETGRKIALTRALKQLFPNDKEARTGVWFHYFDKLMIDRSKKEVKRD